MSSPDLSELLAQVTEIIERAGALLSEEWSRPDGPRGRGVDRCESSGICPPPN